MNLDSLPILHVNYLVSAVSAAEGGESGLSSSSSVVVRLPEPNNCDRDSSQFLFPTLFSLVDSAADHLGEAASQIVSDSITHLWSRRTTASRLLSVLSSGHRVKKDLGSPRSPLLQLILSIARAVAAASSVQDSPRLSEQLSAFIRLLAEEEQEEEEEASELRSEVEACPELVNYILSNLFDFKGLQKIKEEYGESLLEALQRVYTDIPVVLLPYFEYSANIESPVYGVIMSGKSLVDNGIPELIRELGYGFTNFAETCRDTLLKLSRGGEIHAQMVARIIGIMVRTHTGLDDSAVLQTAASSWDKNQVEATTSTIKTWNIEVFISAVHELQPTLHWKEIIYELDHSGFVVNDRAGLILLLKALKLGLQAQGFQGAFPVEMFYRHWKNTEGQVRLIQQCLRNPDIFCFADHSYHSCAIEVLKVQPDWDSREISTWRSIDLVESLLYLADAGHASIVIDLITFPKTHCPDVLALSLLQINQSISQLRRELLSMLFQIFLANHPNSLVILSHAWHIQTLNFKMVVVHSMAEWYSKAVQEGDCEHLRLTRVLDVAQDLKALSLMLNSQPIPFIIDLAVLASRREYLKLEKWLADQMREHGEASVKAVIQYLTRKLPSILGPGPLKEEHVTRSQFPIEALPIILMCLKHFISNAPLHVELRDTIVTIISNCQELLNKRSSVPPPGVLRPSSRTMDAFNSVPTSGPPIRPNPRFDQISNLSGQFSSTLNISGSQPTSSSAFGLPNVMGSLSSGPGSPSRMLHQSSNDGFMHHPHAMPPSTPAPTATTGTSLSAGGMQSGIEQIRQGNISNLFPDMVGPISREIEDEANSYFQRIYNHPPYPTLSIDEVLDLLKRFQESLNQRERDVFNCMIKNLFEEYKYFPQYPDEELHTTAQLFGGIIEHGLVTMVPLGLALRFVLDAVRKPTESNMYFFGVAALDRFKTRLKDYPQYCQHVSCIPHFKEFPTHLIEWVEYGSQSQIPPGKPSAIEGSLRPSSQRSISLPDGGGGVSSVTPATTTAVSTTIVRPTVSTVGGRPSIANTTNIDTLLNARSTSIYHAEVAVPSDKIQDKVAFIFNNLSLVNMQTKASDLKEQFLDLDNEAYYAWLAQYLVMKRVSIEPNFHNLYASLLEVLKLSKLYDEVLRETYGNILILLRSDKAMANYSDRTLLKNLGHWLGLMTLARNRPILMIDLDIKPLIIKAYHSGQQELLYVIPFVAKVIESCAKSKVFKPPCPWTMGIMNLLSELHQEHDLKLNLKFEIEVLCKTLSLDLSHLTPKSILKDYKIGGKLMSSNSTLVPTVTNNKLSVDVSFMPQVAAQTQMTHSTITPSIPFNGGFSSQQPGSAGAGMGGALVATPHMVQNTRYNEGSSVEPLTAAAASMNVGPPATTLLRQSEPKFHYTDINTSNLNGIVPHISVDSRLTLLKDQPDLIQLIKLAIEKSIQEWASPVIDRAIKIALTTCEQIVKKDCALDHNENRIRQSAHHMVRNLTAGMAMITCRDHLLLSIKTHLKNFMITLGRNLTPNQTEAIEMTVSVIANDNVELACAFIQKKAIEKALPEIDKRLKGEYDVRIQARKEGRRYYDAPSLAYQAERMPEMIRLKVGAVTPQQNAVYDEFAVNIPGFKPLTEREVMAIAPKPLTVDSHPSVAAVIPAQSAPVPPAVAPSEDCIAILDEVYSKVEPFVSSCTGLPSTPHMTNLQSLVENLALARSTKDVTSIILLIQKTVEALLEGLTPNLPVETENLARYRDANLLVLRALSDPRAFGPNWTGRQVTLALIESRDDIRYNLDAVDILIRSGLVSLLDYDKHLGSVLQNGENAIATAFAMHLCKIYLIDDRSNAHIIESDLFGTIEVLQKIANTSNRPPDGIVNLMEMIKMSSERLEENLSMSGPTAQLHSGIQQAREFEDPPGLFEKTEFLLREWVNAYHSRDAGKDSRQAFIVFVQHMNQHGILKTDDLITRFFRMSTQMCVDLCYRALAEQTNSPTLVRAKCFHTLDAYVRLITLLVKHSGETQNTVTKVNLLNKVLGIVAGVLLIDHDVRNTDFQQVPYHRIFIMLFLELNSPNQILAAINFQVLLAYTNMLHLLRPTKAPGFAYAWLEIVSHRVFMQQVLANSPQAKGWPMYAQLLVDLFKFLSPFLRNAELTKPVHRLYRGTLRVLLVLLHDFPEFLCDYHYSFCDVIPPNCVQMRNLILSAFPRNMRLPDPFTPNLKVDMLSEISIAPRACTNYSAMLKPAFKKELDSYLRNREPVSFLVEVRSNLILNNDAASPGSANRYNIQMINALVMHVGTSAIQYIRSKQLTPSMSTIAHSSHMDMFQSLAVDLETEGRYLFLNCIANQLRYPNSHTHYFSCTLLYLFAEANSEAIQEQITRVLLERLIVNRPHPWGLLITFIELIKNPSFKFWSHDFVHCAPEIQKLFESVARSCMVPSLPRESNDNE